MEQSPNNHPRMTPEQRDFAYQQQKAMLDYIQGEAATKFAKNNYCVMNKQRSNIVKDPGMNRPFHTPFKNRAEQVAKQTDGVVETLHDAVQYLLNNLGKSLK